MAETTDASPWVPERPTLPRIRTAAPDCRGCELWEPATQVVVGAGSKDARLALVGEQPGDQEDKQGEPFVGPAGRLLDEALEEAHIERADVFVTNAVKHFRFEQRGKRRIHQKPDLRHLVACHPWLDAELDVVDPEVVVAMGATAGRALLGRPVRIGAERGAVLLHDPPDAGRPVVITSHPSAVLRLRGKDGYDEAYADLVADLRVAAGALGSAG